MDIDLRTDGEDADTEALWEWLRETSELRHCLRLRYDDALVVTVTVATPYVVPALTRSLNAYLRDRQTGVTVVVGAVGVTARGLSPDAAETLLRQALQLDDGAARR